MIQETGCIYSYCLMIHVKPTIYFSDQCSTLPDIFDLKTSASLPVDHGTSVKVDCIPGYNLSGSSLITCNKDVNWWYEQTPYCVLGGFSHYSKLHL